MLFWRENRLVLSTHTLAVVASEPVSSDPTTDEKAVDLRDTSRAAIVFDFPDDLNPQLKRDLKRTYELAQSMRDTWPDMYEKLMGYIWVRLTIHYLWKMIRKYTPFPSEEAYHAPVPPKDPPEDLYG